MQIAVIDDGVNPQWYPSIGPLAFDWEVNRRNQIIRRRDSLCADSHGTTCAAILKKYAPEAEIGSLRVLSRESGRGEPKHLLAALRWCGEQRIPLIHLSLGTRLLRDFPELYRQCRELTEAGSVIVAAQANSMKASAPACFPHIISVRSSAILEGEQYLADCGAGLLEASFVASGRQILTQWDGAEQITPVCNSYAAPLITAVIHNLLAQEPGLTFQELRERLGMKEQGKKVSRLWKHPDASVVGVVGDTNGLTERLNRLFLKGGYECLSLNSGMFSLPEGIPAETAIGYFDRMLEPDLILVRWPQPEAWMDYRIYVEKSRRAVRYCGNEIHIPVSASPESVRRAYHYLERLE